MNPPPPVSNDLSAPDQGVEEALVLAVRRALLAHYDRARRELPWRGETDPYRIWVSEVMLQQTRVDTVIPYYRRWLELFPDVESLAAAEMDDVLLAWQGLGYYRRARGLHAGAAVVRERHQGRMPRSVEELRALPGVGEYTAGAVASIAYGIPAPAVDGNVKRVLARLFDVATPKASWLRGTAWALVHPRRPGDWNQALMDLGATVCTPRRPRCTECPLAPWCKARVQGTQDERPRAGARKTVPARTLAVAVLVDDQGRGWVVRRAEEGLLGGLWAFPDREVDADPPAETQLLQAARQAAMDAGATLTGQGGRALDAVRHRFTHLEATYCPVALEGAAPEGEDRRWVALQGPWPVALPVAQQKIAGAAAGAAQDT